jgi:hypothetical protein
MNTYLPTITAIHRAALINALRRLDFSQVNYLRTLPGTGGVGLGRGGGGRGRGYSQRQIGSHFGN